MKKLVKEKLNEVIGNWEFTEVTAAGTVTRNQKSITGEDIIYHDTVEGEDSKVNENVDESSFETLDSEEAITNRQKELKGEGYYIIDSKISKGFIAKKEINKKLKRIVVRLK